MDTTYPKNTQVINVDPETGEITSPQSNSSLVPINPTCSVAEITENKVAIRNIVKSNMKDNVHYMVIPGTSQKSLTQDGAELLAYAYGISISTERIDCTENWQNGFFSYTYRCICTHRMTGMHLISLERSCNSFESKYLTRSVNAKYGSTEDKERCIRIEKKSSQYGSYEVWKVKKTPEELADGINTYMSMAQKRAMVAAIRIATMATDLFRDEMAEPAPHAPSSKTEDPIRTNAMAKLFAVAKELGYSSDAAKKWCYKKYQVQSITDMSTAQIKQAAETLTLELENMRSSVTNA